MQNKLTDTAGFVSAELRFREIDDFSPEKLVYQVPALKRLLEIRGRLSDLLAKLDGNDDLDAKLQEIVASTENLKQIKSEGSVNA
jgi:type VI secretion system protein ImpB